MGAILSVAILSGCGSQTESREAAKVSEEGTGALQGDITFWHSFTQGPRLEVIQKTADQFMKDNPGVNITIETFSWSDFYTKWTTGLLPETCRI